MALNLSKVIDGKKYSTKTADQICWIDDNGLSKRDFGWHDTALFRTKKGNYFVAGEGGPRSRWAQHCGNESMGGEGLYTVTEEKAREIAAKELNVEEFEKFFGVVEEA
jgi:hypothetical protein